MVDTVIIKIKAGDGGDGRVSFRHEKFMPKGGPDGGDGGDGGNVIFIADSNLNTLMDFNSKAIYKAEDGEGGKKKNMKGAAGSDFIVKVPVGTLVYDQSQNQQVFVVDLNKIGQKYVIAMGGFGGKGNVRFKGSVNRTPIQYTEGTKGEEKIIKLEVKIIADVGIVGLPNGGKSTLLNRLTGTSVKVADYPFTTISPNLGVYRFKDGRTIIFADIPGLIEGASQGKGLGEEFLKHIERTRVLIHIIDPLDFNYVKEDIVKNAVKLYDVVRSELSNYGEGLTEKKELVVINKCDVTEVREKLDELRTEFSKKGLEILGISAVTGYGIDNLIAKTVQILDTTPLIGIKEEKEPIKTYTIENLPNKRMVFKRSRVKTKEFKIKGR